MHPQSHHSREGFRLWQRGKGVGLVRSLVFIACGLLLWQNCAGERTIRGQFFPELANPTGGATLILFFTEYIDFTATEEDYFGTANHRDYLIKQLQLVLAQLAQMNPELRILAVDVSENRHIAADHRVYRIPELILFSSSGHELHRWTSDDFDRGGGTLGEIQDTLERIEPQIQKDED